MLQVKIAEGKYTPRKKNIVVKDAFIYEGRLSDDDGTDILAEIAKELPEGVERFSFRLSFELPEEYDED